MVKNIILQQQQLISMLNEKIKKDDSPLLTNAKLHAQAFFANQGSPKDQPATN